MQRPRMNAIATATPSDAPKTPPKRRVSKRVRQAIDLLVTGQCRTQKQAAEKVRMSPEALCRALKRQPERALVEQRVSETIAGAKMKAGAVLEKLMLDGKSEHVRRDVAQYFNELAGYVVQKNAAPSITINNQMIAPGYIVDLSAPADFHALPASQDSTQNREQVADVVDLHPRGPADQQSWGRR
jgi:hypothetical protein